MSSKHRGQHGRKHKGSFKRQKKRDRKQYREAHHAVFEPKTTVETLIRQNKTLRQCSKKECSANGMLTLACQLQHWERAIEIIHKGADINDGDPFTNVLRHGPIELRDLFLERGVKINQQHLIIDPTLNSPLICASTE